MKTDLSPQELMKAFGAKGGYFDPIPPDQHAWPMKVAIENPGKVPPLFRLWSWMCDHSIRKGRRKGYVCDERGRPLSVEDAAHDLKMDPGVCRRSWREGVALGLWRKGTHAADKRQLILNAKVVPSAVLLEDLEGEDDSDTEISDTEKGEEEAKKVCTDLFPPYLRLQIKRLPKSTRTIFEGEYEQNERLFKDVHADVTVAVRLIFDQRENTIFEKFGIKKIREEHTPKNGAAKSPVRVQLVQEFLPGLERFVQTFEERSVQTSDGSVQTSETPVVQTVEKAQKNGATPAASKASGNGAERAVLESKRTSLRPDDTATTTTTPLQAEDVVVVTQKLGVKQTVAQKFLEHCRRASPGCTLQDVIAVIDQVDATINKAKYKNPTPILLETVPVKIPVYRKANEEWRAANTITCWSCHKPIYPEDARMRRAHQVCWDAEEAKETAGLIAKGASGND